MTDSTEAIKKCIMMTRSIRDDAYDYNQLGVDAHTELSVLVASHQQAWELVELAKEIVTAVDTFIIDEGSGTRHTMLESLKAFDLAISGQEGK